MVAVADLATQPDGGAAPLLAVQNLTKRFPVSGGFLGQSKGWIHAVEDVSFMLGHGETLGLVGESGCGKSTAGKTVLKLHEPTGGCIRLDGADLTKLGPARMRPYRRQMQIIFQDPFSSLNPRMTAARIVGEPLVIHRIGSANERQERVAELFRRVGLRPDQMKRYAHEFSGGQRQRLAIARAILKNSPILILDEATSALDAESEGLVQDALANLMRNRTAFVIAHRLSTVRRADVIVALERGRVAEIGAHDELLANPQSVYAKLYALQAFEREPDTAAQAAK
jgi:peptide/nickel transport system ATP-binding protein/oligopeptide transport system ATP-binding protein